MGNVIRRETGLENLEGQKITDILKKIKLMKQSINRSDFNEFILLNHKQEFDSQIAAKSFNVEDLDEFRLERQTLNELSFSFIERSKTPCENDDSLQEFTFNCKEPN